MDNQISIREMLPEEEREVRLLYKRSLGLIDRIAFPLAFNAALKSAHRQRGSCLVALHEGKLVGNSNNNWISSIHLCSPSGRSRA